MTKREKLRLLDMASSKYIADQALCMELLNNNLDCFTDNEIHCLALLASSNDMYAGHKVETVRQVIRRWANASCSDWGRSIKNGTSKWYYEEYKRLINLNEVKNEKS